MYVQDKVRSEEMQGNAPSLLNQSCLHVLQMYSKHSNVQQTAVDSCIDSIAHLCLVQALHSFRDNKSSLLIATPQAARGLDLPAVSHVYNLGPPEDPTEYLHRAGRAGRIGSPVGGVFVKLFV